MTDAALLVTRDPGLREQLARLAAAAGTPLEVATDPVAAQPLWNTSALVLVGADVVAELAGRRPPPHPALHVVALDRVPDAAFREALTLGARDLVELPVAEPWLASLLADVADGVGGAAATVGFVPGSGGAGASTLAAAVAQVGARSRPTALVDLDPWGPGQDRVLGLDEVPGVRWDALADQQGRLGSRSLRDALPGRADLTVLAAADGSADRPDGATAVEVLAALQRGRGLVVLDLPRALDGAAGEVVGRCDLVVLVVRPTLLSVAAATRVRRRLDVSGARVEVAVRGAGPLDAGSVADALELPLLVTVPDRRRVHELVDLGLGPAGGRRSALGRAAREVLHQVDALPVRSG